MQKTLIPVPIATAVSFLFFALYGAIGAQGWRPTEESMSLIGEVSGWCERVSPGFFREPVNTLSNLGFIFIGLSIFFILERDHSSKEMPNSFFGVNSISILYASTALFLGPGSMLMHGTHTAWGEWADNLSMVMYILIPWLYNIKCMAKWSSGTFFRVYFGIVIVYALSRWFFGDRLGIGLDLFGLSIGLWIISEFLHKFWSPACRWLSGLVGFVVAAAFGIMPWTIFADPVSYWWVALFWLPAIFSANPPSTSRTYAPWYWAGILLYMLAFAIWLRGVPNDPWCDPDSVFQPHGAWHLLTALATLCFFFFLRTERTIGLNRD